MMHCTEAQIERMTFNCNGTNRRRKKQPLFLFTELLIFTLTKSSASSLFRAVYLKTSDCNNFEGKLAKANWLRPFQSSRTLSCPCIVCCVFYI